MRDNLPTHLTVWGQRFNGLRRTISPPHLVPSGDPALPRWSIRNVRTVFEEGPADGMSEPIDFAELSAEQQPPTVVALTATVFYHLHAYWVKNDVLIAALYKFVYPATVIGALTIHRIVVV